MDATERMQAIQLLKIVGSALIEAGFKWDKHPIDRVVQVDRAPDWLKRLMASGTAVRLPLQLRLMEPDPIDVICVITVRSERAIESHSTKEMILVMPTVYGVWMPSGNTPNQVIVNRAIAAIGRLARTASELFEFRGLVTGARVVLTAAREEVTA